MIDKNINEHGNHKITRHNFRGYGLLTDIFCITCNKYIWKE